MKKVKYSLGIDIGISSVGWGLLSLDEDNNPTKILDAGVRIFTPGENVKTGESKAAKRRALRGTRRIIRRREERLDRTRFLLYRNGYFDKYIDKNKIKDMTADEAATYLTATFNSMITEFYKTHKTNPYQLKVEALTRKLTDEELSIILVHYAKHRGYKSNREDNNQDSEKAAENTKVKSAIAQNTAAIKQYETISEMFLKDPRFKDRIRNTNGDYKSVVTREMYIDEINKVLDKQVEYGTITEDFKLNYIDQDDKKTGYDIFSAQRHYSKGPGGNSKYAGNLIEKMTGECVFDHKKRAPKHAPSAELFVALTKLINLRYKTDKNGDYQALNAEQIKKAVDLLKTKDELTYNNITSIIDNGNISYQDLDLSKKKYSEFINNFKEKVLGQEKAETKYANLTPELQEMFNRVMRKTCEKNNIEYNENGKNILKKEQSSQFFAAFKKEAYGITDDRVKYDLLTEEQQEKYDKMLNNEKEKVKLADMPAYSSFRKAFTKADPHKWAELKDDFKTLDLIATYLTNYKVNQDIIAALDESKIIEKEYYDLICTLPNLTDHNMLSLDIIYDLIPLMETGMRYDLAMEKNNFVFNNTSIDTMKEDSLPPITSDDIITNQRVLRSLSQSRKVINAIISRYGKPYRVNIETARELTKTKQERNDIENAQQENREKNERIKSELVSSGLFKDASLITGFDLLKYKLWTEQDQKSGYSGKVIKREQVFNKNEVQVDHILPYSRTFNDSYLNKTLVLSEENQKKGNMTPYEWFGKTPEWNDYVGYINSLYINQDKKDNYLLIKLTPEIEDEMRNQNLNDTKTISKTLVNFIKAHLNVEEVHSYPGAATGRLRARWYMNGLTHSIESQDYRLPIEEEKDIKKNRENHLHHALDALVIASMNNGLVNKVARFERYNYLIKHQPKSEVERMMTQNAIIIKDNHTFLNDITGEVEDSDNLNKYLIDLRNKGLLKMNNNDCYYVEYPQPYEGFSNEAITRVYEQNPEKLKKEFSKIYKYTNEDIENFTPITPSFAKNSVSGRLHKDTLYGLKEYGQGDDKVSYKTSRISVADKAFTIKDVEKMAEKDSGSKEVYDTVKAWIGDSNGATMFKEKGYPKNPKTGNLIKKIKTAVPYDGKGHIVNNAIADSDTVYKVGVYKSKDEADQKLYFVSYDLYDLEQIKRYNKKKDSTLDFEVTMWYGHGTNKTDCKYSEINSKFNEYVILNKNDFIKVTKTDGTSALCYSGGSSTGFFEVMSTLGDGRDLYGPGKLFNDEGRYRLTVSTIKSIEKVNIDILGKVNGIQTSSN